ncbi:MAG: hypothetical protein HOK21_22965 [Rhodospirillaceae bacterium]|jgi:hypothetical protein|nr:hypothetical protein [Rhodospirillaceae bacterium]MBT4690903.1 hypothetical protein [Rhodospirillaceae bacterium]MBT5081516.1 hypothetical protein [Rhodospirillaceae bacterium]MBT5526958.1 hypothetical protein [Rhodospirillaceae bacterium]MBT5881854.1 hypothetical protein [Rhodospirillaceae bacterium]
MPDINIFNDQGSTQQATFAPDLIGLGFPKAGTTFIARRLAIHPQIQLSSRKEAHFWTKDTLDFDDYRALFQTERVADNGIFHEWTTDYIYSDTALRNLADHVPDNTTFIIAYRDPVASFFSYYNYRRMINHDCPERHHPLGYFLTNEEYYDIYIQRYFFDTHFARFRQFLPNHRTIVIDHAYLTANLDQTFRQLYELLDLPYFEGHISPGRENASISPRSIFIDRVLRKLLRTVYDDPGAIYRSDFQNKPLWVSMIQKFNAEKYIYDKAVAKQLMGIHSAHLSNFQKLLDEDENAVLISQ